MSQQAKIFFNDLKPLLDQFQERLVAIGQKHQVPLFYEPIQYVLTLPGKRIRPLLTILANQTCGGRLNSALYPALAVELLHNFTLVHDDIMDNDALRRGQPTVHKKWDVATAILAGDGLMGLAFKKLLEAPEGDLLTMMRRFTDVMLIICEGQGLDKMFETQSEVSEEQYLEMIRRKTAVLIELSCELGALSASAAAENIERFRQFGYNLGMAFQIQDDVLDIMADESKLGKTVGSDWQMHKQTVLSIRLRRELRQKVDDLTFEEFKRALNETGILNQVQNMYRDFFNRARQALKELPQNESNQKLQELTDLIQNRCW
ncbi:polyprenyl synthetase family protein [Caldithrix abyssi]|uniref:Geranylgeranyl diphosphate synthase, type I/geranylgeranyl diphosphate synthase, type II n=1 Tax=Caldithrix abyssi DSM 13497 TaxID=880073 RepID=H1XSY0_CALAY|nr:polyprenyl synthetase family protein [Caldithrix abyssi]APF17286.1 geranylgeranyl diphosphate synthase, type I/geranylgeranyl diphosphate synthase, type II [Caldithrix abyssi DSM 13497]EHO41409.1 Polyprenyl synthetase [Caldithrix abyssi DSM 13497]